jgi:hypothetical protein
LCQGPAGKTAARSSPTAALAPVFDLPMFYMGVEERDMEEDGV